MLPTSYWSTVLEYLPDVTNLIRFLTAIISFALSAAFGWRRIRRYLRRRANSVKASKSKTLKSDVGDQAAE
ncbi:hypothetical protein [Actinoplanes awajinensis]|uniref:Uncharacterized protein n=1 Tax=Actinoplanes awajinensis subsp. mycoplanecinus TaxID=135947 RepID=A0A0X3UPV3_9ACTN|nr:hypothetical protein [Actinoplanes awajinensis]KUL34631.1 hypothetical protein ADL15_16335 [Actinoplanes awajinensis subsp. mycoplanecinus]